MISLHYTSHTKAYNTIYTACNIVEAIYSFTVILEPTMSVHTCLLLTTLQRTSTISARTAEVGQVY